MSAYNQNTVNQQIEDKLTFIILKSTDHRYAAKCFAPAEMILQFEK